MKNNKMNITKELDMAIKLAETGDIDGGYLTKDGKTYKTYMTNASWESFKDTMSTQALDEYGAGGGSELAEKGGRPPKMASYGSSSRMIYMLSRNIKNFHFEKRLHTTVGGIANIDGFLDRGYSYVFVEAKCHEPYSAKKKEVSEAYRELYEYINANMPGSLCINMKKSRRAGYMDVEYISDGEILEYFDLKQMICHLLGIASEMLKGRLEGKQTDLIYLLYDPTELAMPKAAKDEIEAIYQRVCYECNIIDFASLLGVIFRYLKEERQPGDKTDEEIDDIVMRFTFTLASPEFYPMLF